MLAAAPDTRLVQAPSGPPLPDRDYVLYWMVAQRRTRWNFGLQHACHMAATLRRPLLVLEGLRAGYRWANARHHRFVLDGMVDNAARCAAHGVTYVPYVEPRPRAGQGLLEALSRRACAVVTDHWPSFFVPRMVAAARANVHAPLVAVDSCGVLPLSAAGRTFTTAASFRRHLQKVLRPHLETFPDPEPLASLGDAGAATVPPAVRKRWPAADVDRLRDVAFLEGLPIDHAVAPVELRGGPVAGEACATTFLDGALARYADDRNDVDEECVSGLAPYLHYGHVSSHEVVATILAREGWSVPEPWPKATGSRAGWWGLSAGAEAFLDQIVTWRELGFVFQDQNPHDYDRFESLPGWALTTLADHAADDRPDLYGFDAFDEARTHDPIWNAAQRQLRRDGRIHNYLRMLWGKKVLEWSPTPEVALETLWELNNRYALDGRDPNSMSGIFWCFGRFDRAWGPERPIFGKVRFMSSASTRRKLRLKRYLARYGEGDPA